MYASADFGFVVLCHLVLPRWICRPAVHDLICYICSHEVFWQIKGVHVLLLFSLRGVPELFGGALVARLVVNSLEEYKMQLKPMKHLYSGVNWTNLMSVVCQAWILWSDIQAATSDC